jgi:hypothetical protein
VGPSLPDRITDDLQFSVRRHVDRNRVAGRRRIPFW